MRTVCGLWLVVLIGLFSTTALAEVIELEVAFEAPELKTDDQGFSHVTQPDTLSLGQVGFPALPVRAVYLALPPGHRVVAVDVDPGERVSLPGEHVVFPAQPPRPLSLPGPIPVAQPDPAVYQSSEPFPAQVGTVVPLQSLRGFTIQPVQLRPVVFYPVTGRLEYSPWMKVSVTTAADKTASLGRVTFRGRPADFARAARLVDNPEVLGSYPQVGANTRNPDYRYVIVTNQVMAACSGANTFR